MNQQFNSDFLNSIQQHQINVIHYSDNIKIFQFADPNTVNLSCTIMYTPNSCTITGDAGHYIFGRLQNPYSFFLQNPSAFNLGYLQEKVIAQDIIHSIKIFDGNLAEEQIKSIIADYRNDIINELDDFELEELQGRIEEFEESLEDIDFSNQLEFENWFYSLDKFSELFEEIDFSQFEKFSHQFIWCVQAVIYSTRLFHQKVMQ